MSGVERPHLFSVPRRKKAEKTEQPESDSRPAWEVPQLSKSDRRAFIRGALGASLLIALAFIVGLGLVILLFTLLR